THKKPYQKFLTLFAGPLFNFLLTLVLFIGLAYYQGTPTNTVDKVAQDSPAAHAGLKTGDTIVKIADKSINSKSDKEQEISQVKDKKTLNKEERDSKTKNKQVKQKKYEQKVTITHTETKYLLGYNASTEHTVFKPITEGVKQTIVAGKLIFT